MPSCFRTERHDVSGNTACHFCVLSVSIRISTILSTGRAAFGLQRAPLLVQDYLNPPEPTFLSGPYKFHIRVYNKNRQKGRVW